MTGLEKIIDKIKDDSEKAAEDILRQAEDTKKEILKKAEEESQELSEKIANDAENKCEQIISRAKSSAELTKTQNVLRQKRQIIDRVIEDAKNELLSYPDDKYFAFLGKLLKKQECMGEIILNRKDKERLPKDFDLAGLVLSDKDGDFDGGFVLVNGNIEINCTVSALFEGAAEELSDTVNGILFRGV